MNAMTGQSKRLSVRGACHLEGGGTVLSCEQVVGGYRVDKQAYNTAQRIGACRLPCLETGNETIPEGSGRGRRGAVRGTSGYWGPKTLSLVDATVILLHTQSENVSTSSGM